MNAPAQIFTTEPLAVRGLAALIASEPTVATRALRAAGVPLLGRVVGGTVRCETGDQGRRSDLTGSTTRSESFLVEAKIDALPDSSQIRDALSDSRWQHVVLLVPSAANPDVVEACNGQDGVTVIEWAHLLEGFPRHLPRLLARDVVAIVDAPASKGRQREALRQAQSSLRPRGWHLTLNPGTSGWPSIILESPSGQVLGQVEGPRSPAKALTFGGAVGFTLHHAGGPRSDDELVALLRSAQDAIEAAERRADLRVSRQRGDSSGRAERLAMPDWMTRGYGDSYVGVRTQAVGDAHEALRRLVEVAKLLEAVARASTHSSP